MVTFDLLANLTVRRSTCSKISLIKLISWHTLQNLMVTYNYNPMEAS